MKSLNFKNLGTNVSIIADSHVNIYLYNNVYVKNALADIVNILGLEAYWTYIQKVFDVKHISFYFNNCRAMISIIITKDEREFTSDYFRNEGFKTIKKAIKSNFKKIQFILPDFNALKKYYQNNEHYFRTLIEGINYGAYDFDKYKSQKETGELDIYLCGPESCIEKALIESEAVMSGALLAKELANEPSMVLTPNEFILRAKMAFKKSKIRTEVFDSKKLKKLKMQGILAVGAGSDNPPCLFLAKYKADKPLKKIILVGKGITFDSGGISIKPSLDMDEMKADISGASVVIGTLIAASKMKLQADIIGIMPLAENMPSGKAYKPGDIITTASGKTVEIISTDAEGRLLLADSLHYASKMKPNIIIDFATLTGAIVVGLGECTAGLFCNDNLLADKLYQAGLISYERVWRMPLWNEYSNLIKSDIADLKNTGGKWGGAIAAAKFLEKFVHTDIMWAHIDIAGPAIRNDFSEYSKKYMTGFGVRLAYEYLKSVSTE